MLDADDAECGVFDAQPSWKWSYRKRRSIHDRALPRETLIAAELLPSIGDDRYSGPLVAAPCRFAQRS
ncbi:hypothetical protein C1C98_27475 [Pseudomonas ogarae]|uniref:Uncharacterized protein n=1 Tax=Pseudomonas ogarae (strain DSM 112162 / CECT 30235 / F113) TaxID=1114970 RepID=A0ABM6R617_PSEO1|nr:hypothetical protein C1C98_27475 [Pseudomonas ogarae]